ncbi:hypothetical protein SDC9_150592 [bioreactor metagenome]|uniref:Uncharacterized protein n=1 Tax=bioreactor metagenome TaxID=1076179 RepID=A0A645ES70_9ZZZZ
MLRAAGGVKVIAKGVVRVVKHADGGAGGTVGGDGGEGEQRLVKVLGHGLAGVNGTPAAHGKNHVGLLYLRQLFQRAGVLVGRVAAVPNGLRQGKFAAGKGSFQWFIRLAKGGFAANDGGGFAKPAGSGKDILIAVGADAPGGQAAGVTHTNDPPVLCGTKQKQPRPKVLL